MIVEYEGLLGKEEEGHINKSADWIERRSETSKEASPISNTDQRGENSLGPSGAFLSHSGKRTGQDSRNCELPSKGSTEHRPSFGLVRRELYVSININETKRHSYVKSA